MDLVGWMLKGTVETLNNRRHVLDVLDKGLQAAMPKGTWYEYGQLYREVIAGLDNFFMALYAQAQAPPTAVGTKVDDSLHSFVVQVKEHKAAGRHDLDFIAVVASFSRQPMPPVMASHKDLGLALMQLLPARRKDTWGDKYPLNDGAFPPSTWFDGQAKLGLTGIFEPRTMDTAAESNNYEDEATRTEAFSNTSLACRRPRLTYNCIQAKSAQFNFGDKSAL